MKPPSSENLPQVVRTIIYKLLKGPRFSEKDWYYLEAQTDMPFHHLKLVI